MDAISAFLPQEIVTNMLIRLPVKSLIRFRCVCKHWKNLIDTPSFREDHFQHSIQKPSLIFQQNLKGDPFCLYLIDHHMQLLEFLNVPINNPLFCVSIVDSTNGLVCFKIDPSGLFAPSFLLWNPATRQIRSVPENIHDFNGNFHTAFGFTPIGNDYKIVMIHYGENDDEGDDGVVGLIYVEVYSLCRGSWKKVDYFEIDKPLSKIVTANGVIFRCGLEHEDEDIYIISFDLATETFAWISMPDVDTDGGFDLAVYANKLAIGALTCGEYVDSFVLDLWVMEEGTGAFEERWTWTKKLTISFDSGFLFPCCILKNESVGSVNKLRIHNSEAECEEDTTIKRSFYVLFFGPTTSV